MRMEMYLFTNINNSKVYESVLVCLLFLFSIGFRLWFITLAPQPFAWDQDEYQWYATKMYYQPHMLASHTYRSYPYSLFMAVVYKFTGFANHEALFRIQAIIDSLTGVMVYVMLRQIYPRFLGTALLGFVLYAINPFTSGYVGLGLSEVVTAFFITATLLTGLFFINRQSILTALLFGISAGMAAETRNAAFLWAAIPILLTLLFVRFKKNIGAYIAIALGIFLTMLYPLYVNWREYRQVSFTTVDSFYAKEFFNGAVLKILPPFTYKYPVVTQQMFWEYYSEFYPQRLPADRKAMAAKYYQKAWEIIKTDPIDYIRWRFFKMWYVWQKENIFFYQEPFFTTTRMYVYWGNIVLLVLAFVGIVQGFIAAKVKHTRWIWASILGTILYATGTFAFTHAEYRITIPFYPLLILSAAAGIHQLKIKNS